MAWRRKRMGGLRRKNFRRKKWSNANLEKKIKAITLKNCETKQVSDWYENNNLYHNRTSFAMNRLLSLTQGVASPDAFNNSNNARIGDSVIARGIKVKLWFATKQDRPNCMFQIYAYSSNPAYPVNELHFWRGSNGGGGIMNRMVDAPNTNLVKIKKKFKIFSGPQYYMPVGGENPTPPNYEHSYFKEFYIPLNNRVIRYNDGGNAPKKDDINIAITAYDVTGTLQTDIIAHFTGSYTFYFKDP